MHQRITILAIFVCVLILSTTAQVSHKEGNCPLRNSVSKCTPSCVSDHQCILNQKCCPNKCGHRSCADPSSVSTGKDGGYKGSYDNTVYCNGVKCAPFEKCVVDRNTKRQKCGRA